MAAQLQKVGEQGPGTLRRRRRGRHVPRSATLPRVRAGAGKRLITPPVGGPLVGIPERDLANGSSAVHDQLYARALVLDNGLVTFALVSVDLFAVSHALTAEIARRVNARTGIPEDNVILVASHTHSGPSISKTIVGGEPDGDWLALFISETANVVKDAFESMRPARIGVNVGQCPIVMNRRFGLPDNKTRVDSQESPPRPVTAEESTDSDLGVVRVSDLGGKTIAVVANYACRPSTVGKDGAFLISADFPGVFASLIESAYPGAVALFTNGAAADIVHRQHIQSGGQTSAGYRDTMLVAELLADETLRLISKVRSRRRVPLSVARKKISMPLDVKKVPAGRAKETKNTFQAVSKFEKQVLAGENPDQFLDRSSTRFIAESRWAPAMAEIVRRGKCPRQVETSLWAASIGNLVLVTAPGEMYCSSGKEVKKRSAFKHTFVLGYAGGYLGFLAPRDVCEQGGWDVEEAFIYLPDPALPLVPGTVEDTLIDHMLSLARSVVPEGKSARQVKAQ